jgi:glyoxylase-like metal-dependent hydrolase (beta-lactamase superfamily II)
VTVFERGGVTVWKEKARLGLYTLDLFAFYVDGLLIDAGSWSRRKSFRAFCAPLPLTACALTHLHEDHCGNASWLNGRGVPVYCPAACVAEAAVEPRLPLYRRLIWGRRPAFRALPLPEIVRTPSHEFSVVPAPGHTPDEVLFFEERESWLFTGDFYLTWKPKVIFQEEDLARTMASIRAVLALPFDLLFDAHLGPVTPGREMLKKKLDYLEELQGQVEALRAKGMDEGAIDRALFPKKPLLTYVSRGEWSSLNMVRTLKGKGAGEGAKR